ncbi:MAG: hypothetical protein ACOYOA_03715 [Saprospiraceae bacterium]
MEQFDKFEKFLQQEFDHYEAETADESWELIREKLHPKPKRRFFGFWLFPVIGLISVAYLIQTYSPVVIGSGTTASLISARAHKSTGEVFSTNPTPEINSENAENLYNNAAKNGNASNTLAVNTGGDMLFLATKGKHGNRSQMKNIDDGTNAPFAESTRSGLQSVASKNPNVVEERATSIVAATREAYSSCSALAILAPSFVEFTNQVSMKRRENDALIAPIHQQKNKGVRLYAAVGISSNYRDMSANSSDIYYVSNVQAPALTSIDRLGIQASLGLKYQLTKRIAIRPTINYQGYYHKLDYIVYENELNSISGLANGSNYEFSNVTYKNTQVKERDFNHSIGLQTDIMYAFNKTDALIAGAGLGKMLGNNGATTQWLNISWQHRLYRYSIEPFVQMSLIKQTATNNYYYYQPFSFGIKFGF